MKKIIKLALCGLLILAVLCGFCACGDDGNTSSGASSKTTSTAQKSSSDFSIDKVNSLLSEPKKGEEAAVLHTNMGDIYIRLFDTEAPKAVENFKGLIKKGYYNGIIFHRVINDFMIQGGDPTGTGTSGESIWGKSFEDEFSPNALNLRGTLAMANSGVNTNGSQFFINQKKPSGSAGQLKNVAIAMRNQTGSENATPDPDLVPDEVWDLYAKMGGNMNLDGAFRHSGGHTVFGYVYKGMDVVDAIAAVKTGANDKPVSEVVIQSAELITVA